MSPRFRIALFVVMMFVAAVAQGQLGRVTNVWIDAAGVKVGWTTNEIEGTIRYNPTATQLQQFVAGAWTNVGAGAGGSVSFSNTWSLLYSGSTPAALELPLGNTNRVLTSSGSNSPPFWMILYPTFPLTNNVSAAGRNITSIGTASGTAANFSSYSGGSMSLSGDVSIGGNLTVTSNTTFHTVINTSTTIVAGVTTSYVNQTVYSTNISYQTTVIVTNYTTYSTNYQSIETVVYSGGYFDASNATWVGLIGYYGTSADTNVTLTGTWDFTGATVVGVGGGSTNAADIFVTFNPTNISAAATNVEEMLVEIDSALGSVSVGVATQLADTAVAASLGDAAENDVLTWDGAAWTNSPPASSTTYGNVPLSQFSTLIDVSAGGFIFTNGNAASYRVLVTNSSAARLGWKDGTVSDLNFFYTNYFAVADRNLSNFLGWVNGRDSFEALDSNYWVIRSPFSAVLGLVCDVGNNAGSSDRSGINHIYGGVDGPFVGGFRTNSSVWRVRVGCTHASPNTTGWDGIRVSTNGVDITDNPLICGTGAFSRVTVARQWDSGTNVAAPFRALFSSYTNFVTHWTNWLAKPGARQVATNEIVAPFFMTRNGQSTNVWVFGVNSATQIFGARWEAVTND